jgi:hypothetical protein
MQVIIGLKNRVLHLLAHFAPGAMSVRVWLHRLRGVKIGRNVWIGYDVVLETSRPDLIAIGNNTVISVRAMLIAHFREREGIRIEGTSSSVPAPLSCRESLLAVAPW